MVHPWYVANLLSFNRNYWAWDGLKTSYLYCYSPKYSLGSFSFKKRCMSISERPSILCPKHFSNSCTCFFFLIKNCHIILVFILIILEFVIPVCPWFSIFNPFYIIFVSLDSPLSLLIFLPPQYQLNIKKSTRQFKKTWEPYWIWTYETKIRGKFQNFIWILGRDSIMSQVVRKDHFTKAIFAD